MFMFIAIFLFLGLSLAQSQPQCENDGLSNGTNSCSCPPGFGGATCSEIGCGGNIFQGSQRPLTSTSGSGFANLTSSGCSCESGWTGTGCNVCQSANSCQSAASSIGLELGDGEDGLNHTLVCNTSPKVSASSQMSCNINNPTLEAIYPLKSTLNIIRTLDPSLSPLPNTTSFGPSGSLYAQLFYEGEEQFYCQADSCTQDSNSNQSNWQCQNLACHCRPNTTFCGGVPLTDLSGAINPLSGTLNVNCNSTSSCSFQQSTLSSLFGSQGLVLDGCVFGECVEQSVLDGTTSSNGTQSGSTSGSAPLSGGVIAGLAVVGSLLLLAVVLFVFGWLEQRRASRKPSGYQLDSESGFKSGSVGVEWSNITYIVPNPNPTSEEERLGLGYTDDKVILDSVTGRVLPGEMMAILGPSGAGKTTLIEILAGKHKSGSVFGQVDFPDSTQRSESDAHPRIGFVPQQDILPPSLTVYEALLFAARLRLPEYMLDDEKRARVDEILSKLGIEKIRNVRIGYGDGSIGGGGGGGGGGWFRVGGGLGGSVGRWFGRRKKRSGGGGGGRGRGISGGEMRRVSIGLELIASPDVLILDEPTSGLDSVSAARVTNVLHTIAKDPKSPTAVIASIHQPSSHLYQTFDTITVLSHGRALYSGPGGFAPVEYFAGIPAAGAAPMPEGANGSGSRDEDEDERAGIKPYQQGYNVADYLLEVASDPPLALFQTQSESQAQEERKSTSTNEKEAGSGSGKGKGSEKDGLRQNEHRRRGLRKLFPRSRYATTFLTQLEVLCGREWKILQRDKTLFFTHVGVAAVLGVFCGGLYFNINTTIAGFQSRVGCLFFLGALIAFSSLSALYNIMEIRPLFLRERSGFYYSPTAWLLSRFLFDVVPLRLVPTIIVSTITYWMAGLAPDAAHFFKFLFILVLYSLALTLFNFLLGTFFRNGGIAILLSALTALYQMTYAGFFVHLNSIPPVLRWLQWLCPLKYCLEALSVNEVGSGLMIQDSLQGVPVDVSASLIMNLLFGFGENNYYRDVLVLFAFIAGFGLGVIGVVWVKVRERR